MFDVVTIGSGSGIGSVILFIIKALIYKKLLNRNSILYVDTRQSVKVVSIFLHKFIHFVKPGEVEFIGHDLSPKFELFDTNKIVNDLEHIDPQIKLNLGQYFFKKHFRYQEWIQDILNNDPVLKDNYDFSIMIRRGCKLTLEPHLTMSPLDSYLKYIDKKQYKNIFLASDDISILNDIKIIRPELNIRSVLKETDKGFFMWEVQTWNDEQTNDHIIKFCKELHILSTTPETMSDPHSNVYAITLYMREFEPTSIIVDYNLHPNFSWKKNSYFV